jgi:hypothetical protein
VKTQVFVFLFPRQSEAESTAVWAPLVRVSRVTGCEDGRPFVAGAIFTLTLPVRGSKVIGIGAPSTVSEIVSGRVPEPES